LEKSLSNTNNWPNRINLKIKRLAFWTAAWLFTMAAASFGTEYLWSSNQWLIITAVLINLAAGTGMIFANIRHLKVLDEMMQKVQLEAMGLALGVGIVGGSAYSILVTANIIASNAQISFIVMLMALTYIAAILIGMRRYR
jgi:hypothetical protein